VPGVELIINKELRRQLEIFDDASSIFEEKVADDIRCKARE
jgi:hypothetical protein